MAVNARSATACWANVSSGTSVASKRLHRNLERPGERQCGITEHPLPVFCGLDCVDDGEVVVIAALARDSSRRHLRIRREHVFD